MLTEDELAALESLLVRARAAAGQVRSETGGTVNVGDLVQLRPGADPHWQTSLLLVCKIRDDGRISGVVLRPHRSGSRDAWYTYSPPEVLRIGRAPFPPPESAVAAASFLAQCPRCLGREGVAPFLEPTIDPYCPTCSAAARSKPIQQETRGRKKKPITEVSAALISSGPEDQPAIEEQLKEQLNDLVTVPKRSPAGGPESQDGAEPLPEPKPIQSEPRGLDDRQDGEIAALRIGQWLVVDNGDDDDYSTWLTTQQAAKACGVHTNTIAHWAQANRLRVAKRKRPLGGPAISVYHPGDVERIAQEQEPQKHDYSTWLTKQQAAEACGCHVHTIERLAEANQLQVAKWKRPQGGSPIAVYNPGDVERIAQGRDIPGFALTPERRSAIAKQGAAARWGQTKDQQQDGAAALPDRKPIQRETSEITALQIGQRLWVMPA